MGTCLDFTSANPHPHSTAGRWVGNWLRPSWGLCIPGNESSLASTEMLFPILGSVWSFQEPRTLWQRNAALPASWLSLFPVHTVFLQNKIPRWKHSYYVLNLTARTSLVAQTVKNLPAMQETRARSLGREDPLEEEMTTHSRILAWERNPVRRGAWRGYRPWGCKATVKARPSRKVATAPGAGPLLSLCALSWLCESTSDRLQDSALFSP